MKHEEYREMIYLLANDELNANEKSLMEKHLETCESCRVEYEEQIKLKEFLSGEKESNSFEQLLNEARLDLHTALRLEKINKSAGDNLYDKLMSFFSQPYKFAMASAAFLVTGLFIGFLIFNNPAKESQPQIAQVADNQNIQTVKNATLLQDNTRITNLRFINQNLNSGEVEFTFDAVKPMTIKGNVNDQKIQNILTYSMLNEQNPGIRLSSINAISNNQPSQLDNDVKKALISVVKFDNNPGVRREALKMLQKYPQDEKLKETFLYVLLHDSTSGNRIEAINSLVQAKNNGYKFDQNEMSIFQKTMQTDDNNYIRYRARNVVEERK
jgi:Putative zinc-finger